MLKHFAEVLAWLSIFAGLAGIIGLGYVLYIRGETRNEYVYTDDFMI